MMLEINVRTGSAESNSRIFVESSTGSGAADAMVKLAEADPFQRPCWHRLAWACCGPQRYKKAKTHPLAAPDQLLRRLSAIADSLEASAKHRAHFLEVKRAPLAHLKASGNIITRSLDPLSPRINRKNARSCHTSFPA